MEKLIKKSESNFNKIKGKISAVKIKIKNLFKNIFSFLKKPMIFATRFFGYCAVYGLIINYMLLGIFGVRFKFQFFLAYGILAYLIKEELPLLWHKLRGK